MALTGESKALLEKERATEIKGYDAAHCDDEGCKAMDYQDDAEAVDDAAANAVAAADAVDDYS